MVKPEWGTKRTCPKCSTRFYDLGKNTPVTCIACGHTWEPEPILKAKQPQMAPVQPEKPKAPPKPKPEADDGEETLLEGEDIEIEESDDSSDDDDDMIADVSLDDDDADVSDVIDTKLDDQG